jgi:hypothetical protein
MAKGILLVETSLSSPAAAAEYHTWYDEIHLPEMLGVEGFVSARRFESLDGMSFVAVYEIETDVETAKANLAAAQAAGTMSTPVGVRRDPPPSVRYLRQISSLTR